MVMQPVVPAFRCWFSCRNEWLFSAFAALLLLNFGSFTVSGSARAAVGRLPGQFSVTSTGAATYDIALAIPAGINGLTPQIALHYSSTAGDGPLGVGWSIAGLSEISRCSKTAATNGAAQGIHFDTTDQFCLDGMPLVKEAGGSNSAACTVQTAPSTAPKWMPIFASFHMARSMVGHSISKPCSRMVASLSTETLRIHDSVCRSRKGLVQRITEHEPGR